METSQSLAVPGQPDRLPLAGLLALSMTSFIATANETVPAGLLPHIALGFEVSPSWAGQLVTLCAFGSGLGAIPLTAATRGWSRRHLLMLALSVFVICNGLTALSTHYALTLVARFLVGLATGLSWSLLASYARRMVPAPSQGRAVAVAMLGIPLALSFGVPLSAWIGTWAGWRSVFAIMAAMSLLLMGLVRWTVPDFAGQAVDRRLPLRAVLRTPGVRAVLFVVAAWILPHYMLYTYIAPLLASLGFADRLDAVLLVFGLAAMFGIWMTGLLVDRWLRVLVMTGMAAFAVVSLMFGRAELSVLSMYVCVALWGISFGGAPTLLQTGLADVAGDGAEVAQSMLVTVFNLAFAGSGVLGGVLLESVGARAFSPVVVGCLVAGLCVAWRAKVRGFPQGRRDMAT